MRRGALKTPDGETLALRQWLDTVGAPRAQVVLCHGLGEHVGRYDHVARRLNDWGFAVQGYDHHGHGESSGTRGGLPQARRLIDDLARVIDHVRQGSPDSPLILLGHSMGGLVAAGLVARDARPVDALVLSSPALVPALSLVQGALIALLSRIAPGLRLGNGLDANDLSHDPAVAPAYRADPLNHDRISARLARFLAEEGAQVLASAPRWPVQTLLLYAGADRLVLPEGSEAFARTAASTGKVTARPFARHFHELFNEQESTSVFNALWEWLDARFPASAPVVARTA